MKSAVKSLIATVMALVIAVSACITGFAFNFDAEVQADYASQDDVVATISLCSTLYVAPIAGHTWIYIENKTANPIQVGLYTVPAYEGMSVGTHSFSAVDGWGIYYNLETYREGRKFQVNEVRSVTKNLNASQLAKVSDKILNYPNMWSFYFNCAFFTFSIWNSATGSLWIPLVIPGISHLEVIMAGGKKGVLDMKNLPPEKTYRQEGTGSSARLVPASEGTYNHS